MFTNIIENMKKLLKKFGFICLVLWSSVTKAQEIKFIKELPFNDELITSECALAYQANFQDRLVGVFLTINNKADQPHYFSTVVETFDRGENWDVVKELSPLAADPWVKILPNEDVILTDISEGNKFHLKSYRYSNNNWISGVQGSYGHDHATILIDSIADDFYIFSTQNDKVRRKLFIHVQGIEGREGNTLTFELFDDEDFSVKKPAILNKQIAIPVVLKERISQEGEETINQKSSWLIMYDKNSRLLSSPSLITNLCGTKHHILVADPNHTLYYLFTDVERRKLMAVKSDNYGAKWSVAQEVIVNEGIVNLDAAISFRDKILIAYTKEVDKGRYQKVLVGLNEDLSTDFELNVGNESAPTMDNGWTARAWPQGGDYCGMIGHLDGHAYLLWSSAPEGLFRPYFAKIQLP